MVPLFIASWADHENYQTVVEHAWQRVDNGITSKLDQVRVDSIVFNKEVFGNIFQRKRWVEGRLRGVQRELDKQVSSELTRLGNSLQT